MTFYIGHIADTHIGYRDGAKMTEEGVNIREQDGYDALAEVVDRLIELKEAGMLNIVIHGGDIFHTSHPKHQSNRMGSVPAYRLYKAGIPFYGLAGNHDASDERANIAAVAPIHAQARTSTLSTSLPDDTRSSTQKLTGISTFTLLPITDYPLKKRQEIENH